MTDVCLVLMPYASVERPSIALGLLKSRLQQQQIKTKTCYPNINFAEEIGLDVYTSLSDVLIMHFLGEWTFSQLAFPEFQPNDLEYFRLVKLRSPQLELDVFLEVREKTKAFVNRIAHSILDLQPRLVGCSSTFQQHCASLALLRRIKELNPEIVTFMGGANCESEMGVTTHREFPWVDFVLSGEGDDLLPKFCQKILEYGRDVNSTKLPYGVIAPSHRQATAISIQAPRASAVDLDLIPTPDYDDYFQTLKNSKIAPYVKPGLLIETARGCWWGQKHHCTFCGLNGSGISFRSKSPARVMEEVRELTQKYNSHKLEVVDNILDMDYMDTVLPLLAAEQEHQEPYRIFYETKANLKREHVEQLASAGVRWIQPGIENMHDGVLKLINKGTTAWVNTQLLKWAREFGMRVAWNFLCDIPGELDEWYAEMASWLPLIFHLQPPSGVTRIRFDRFSPYHERAADWGLELLPNRMYSFIYPLPIDKISDLAYFFEDSRETARRKPDDNGRRNNRPGLEALNECVKQWNRLEGGKEPPMLSMKDDGERFLVTDTRPCATQAQLSLEGLMYWVYKVCDRALSAKELLKQLRLQSKQNFLWEEIEPVIAELQELKILLKFNNRYLSLAVKEPYLSYLPSTQFPGGYVDLNAFKRSKRKQPTTLEMWGFTNSASNTKEPHLQPSKI
ncbi:MAG TPA: RiPP maturation radical SAM C-methyltransferase [Coleofasciculaceae cyanobacterium]|jgi:magnesium-protoporphyrin IX monomethyl ester (oxidative) cyclase